MHMHYSTRDFFLNSFVILSHTQFAQLPSTALYSLDAALFKVLIKVVSSLKINSKPYRSMDKLPARVWRLIGKKYCGEVGVL